MMTLTRRAALWLALPLAAGLAACQSTTAVPTTSTGDMSRADLDFVANAQNIIEFDREECVTAQRQGSPAIRAIAAKLLDDANAFDARLQPLLKETGIRPPSELRSDLRVRLAHMRLQNGLDFDDTFLDDQIQTHQEIIDRQQMMQSDPGMNPKITALARDGAAILKRNLAELQRLRRQMSR